MPTKLISMLMFVFAGVFAFAETATLVASATPNQASMQAPAPAAAPTTAAAASAATIHAPGDATGGAPGLLLSSLETGKGVCYSTENCSGPQIATDVRQEWCDNASATHSWLSANGNCFH